MNLESKQITDFWVTSYNTATKKINEQSAIEIHKHQVPKGYLVLSKNDFGKVKSRVNVGYFNKKTNFIIGEENSLIVLNKETMSIEMLNTSEIIKNQYRYFMLYDLNFIKKSVDSITIQNKKTDEKVELKLNSQFGKDLGEFLKKYDFADPIPEKYEILKAIISLESNRLSLNKHILVNSNISFLIGILEGYLGEDSTCVIKNNINVYNFVYILNLLGAQYSIRSIDNNQKHIRFRLPLVLKAYSNLAEKYFRSHKYIIEDSGINLKKNIIELAPDIDNDIVQQINSGWIELIPMKDLKLLPIENEIMYDLTMPNADAQNYFMPMTPLMKNSDGDVLGVIGMHTSDAADECAEKFGTMLKQKFLSLNDGKVQNWGIKLDAALGLFNSTK